MPCPYVRETITRLHCFIPGMRRGTTCGERRVDGHSGEMRNPYYVRTGVRGMRRRWIPACAGMTESNVFSMPCMSRVDCSVMELVNTYRNDIHTQPFT